MALPARFSLLHSDLSDFVFATVGEEQNGMPLNVVSGLTRLGLDPWDEAARLAVLPKALAAEKLAPMIARLPFERPHLSDNLAISQQSFCQDTNTGFRKVGNRPAQKTRNIFKQ